MSLPVLKLRMIPETRCVRCGMCGYCDHVSQLCGGCLGISLAIFHKRKMLNLAERFRRNAKEFERIADGYKIFTGP